MRYDAPMPTLSVNLAYDAPDSGVELSRETVRVQALTSVVRTAEIF